MVGIKPKDYLSHFYLATLLEQEGSLEEAVRHHLLFLQWAPTSDGLRERRERSKNRIEAIQDLNS